jgi:hypothetical protein
VSLPLYTSWCCIANSESGCVLTPVPILIGPTMRDEARAQAARGNQNRHRELSKGLGKELVERCSCILIYGELGDWGHRYDTTGS